MGMLYQPKGKAQEYGGWALTLFKWCPHGCRYCFAPMALHMKPEQYHVPCGPIRPLPTLERELKKFNSTEPVFLSFIGDPWPNVEDPDKAEYLRRHTHSIIEQFHKYNVRLRTLTKAPMCAVGSTALLRDIDAEFGVSLVWADDTKRAVWEPHAESVEQRLEGVRHMATHGITTWASVEPVIEPQEALDAIQLLADAGVVEVKVGMLNYQPTPVPVNWAKFREDTKTLCAELDIKLLVKRDLEMA